MRIREDFIRLVGVKDGERILDVGTGSGFFSNRIRQEDENWQCSGNRCMDAHGRRNTIRNAEIEGVSDKVIFKVADASDYFDRVVASFIIHIIRGWEKAVSEMVRVLKPGGIFAVLEPRSGWAGGWKVDQNLKAKLSSLGLKNIEIKPFLIYYPKNQAIFDLLSKKKKSFHYNWQKGLMRLIRFYVILSFHHSDPACSLGGQL